MAPISRAPPLTASPATESHCRIRSDLPALVLEFVSLAANRRAFGLQIPLQGDQFFAAFGVGCD